MTSFVAAAARSQLHDVHDNTMRGISTTTIFWANIAAREVFDFTNRTGVIEFDLDGSKRTRQLWYLDFYPAGPDYGAGRKRDISGHVALETNEEIYADPAYLLRFVQEGQNGQTMRIKFANAQGRVYNLADFTDVYRNNACGRSAQSYEKAERRTL